MEKEPKVQIDAEQKKLVVKKITVKQLAVSSRLKTGQPSGLCGGTDGCGLGTRSM